jgi:hypothetical protein
MSIVYSEGVFVALGIQHATGMCHVAFTALQNFPTLSQDRQDFGKKSD